MGEQNSPEQDLAVVDTTVSLLLQKEQQPQHQQRQPFAGITKTTSPTKPAPTAVGPQHTIQSKQIAENTSSTHPWPFFKTASASENNDAAHIPFETTINAAAETASSPTDMEGVIEEEIALLQIQQISNTVDNTSPFSSIFDDSSSPSPENSLGVTKTFTRSPTLPLEAQSNLLKECGLALSQTPESVEQEDQGQSELMDVDVIMTDETETTAPSMLSVSEDAPIISLTEDPKVGGIDRKEAKECLELKDPDNESDSDNEDNQENNEDHDHDNNNEDEDEDEDGDEEDDEEAVADKGKGRASPSSSAPLLPREPILIMFEDAVYSAVPVSSELYIIPYCSKGFSWNADLFLKPHQRRNLGLEDLYRTLSTESHRSSSISSTSSSSSGGDNDDTRNHSVDSAPISSSGNSSHGSAIHVHEILLNDLDTFTIMPN